MKHNFRYDERLGISLPSLNKPWEEHSLAEQADILKEWEAHRSDIPTRVKELEKIIEHKQDSLSHEDDFQRSCQFNDEIVDLANTIHELNIWFGIQQDTKQRKNK